MAYNWDGKLSFMVTFTISRTVIYKTFLKVTSINNYLHKESPSYYYVCILPHILVE